jgi:hypothetical protein
VAHTSEIDFLHNKQSVGKKNRLLLLSKFGDSRVMNRVQGFEENLKAAKEINFRLEG